MELFAFILLTVLFAAVWALCIRGSVHIFQLNSYKPKVQGKWIYDHMLDIIPKICWLVLVVPLVLKLRTLGMLISCAVCVVTICFNLPKKAKKPLVVTARVKRLFLTLGLIHALLVLAAALSPEYRDFFIMLYALAGLCENYLVLAANRINSPIEKAINRHYIRDAERMIREMPELKVIGVTGSYGKTSVKFFAGRLLGAKYNTLITPESYNTTMGVVRTIREQLRPTHEVFVCEMGARNVGDVREICDIVHPSAGIVTSIGPQHLESFGSIENVTKTKFELVDSLPEGGKAFLNLDNEYIAARAADIRNVVGYRLAPKGAEPYEGVYCAYDVSVSARGSAFKLREPDGSVTELSTRLIGEHNVLNICGAVAVAREYGVEMRDIAARVRRLESVPHRLELLGGGARAVIDDAYNSNPAGAKAALDALSQFDALKILVTPGMVELGARQEELNRAFGAQAAAVCDLVVLVGERQTQPIAAGLLGAGFAQELVKTAETVQEAVALADAFRPGEARVILLENDLPDNY